MRTPFRKAALPALLALAAAAARAETSKQTPFAVDLEEPVLAGRLANGPVDESLVVRVSSRIGRAGRARVVLAPTQGQNYAFGPTTVDVDVPAKGARRVAIPIPLHVGVGGVLSVTATATPIGPASGNAAASHTVGIPLRREWYTVVVIGEDDAVRTRLDAVLRRVGTLEELTAQTMGGTVDGPRIGRVDAALSTLQGGRLPLGAADVLWLGPGARPISAETRERLVAYVARGGHLIDRAGTGISTTGWGAVRRETRPLLNSAHAWIPLLKWDMGAIAPSAGLRKYGFLGGAEFAAPLDRIHGMEAPAPTVLIGYLLGYLLLAVPVQYVVLRLARRPGLAWATGPALAVLFTLGAYRHATASRPDHVVANQRVWIEAAPGARTAFAQVAVGLYSPNGGAYDLASGVPGAIPDATDAPAWRIPEDPALGGVLEGCTVPPWSVHSATWTVPSLPIGQGITADLRTTSATTAELTVRNGTPWTLEGLRVTAASPDIDRRLAPGESVRIPIDRARCSTSATGEALARVLLEGAFAASPAALEESSRASLPKTGPRILLTARLAERPWPVAAGGRRVEVQDAEAWLAVPLLPADPAPAAR